MFDLNFVNCIYKLFVNTIVLVFGCLLKNIVKKNIVVSNRKLRQKTSLFDVFKDFQYKRLLCSILIKCIYHQ